MILSTTNVDDLYRALSITFTFTDKTGNGEKNVPIPVDELFSCTVRFPRFFVFLRRLLGLVHFFRRGYLEEKDYFIA